MPQPSSSPLARRLLLMVGALAALALPGTAHAAVPTLAAGFESADFGGVSQSSVLDGALALTTATAYDGRHAAVASYSGDGSNGYARAVENVDWSPGAEVWYGGAYRLPTGYLASLKGGNDIMRWDNWSTYGSDADYGAIENWSDGATRLVLGRYVNDPGIVLGRPFRLPEGRWFWLEVHQAFSTTAGRSLSDVYLDGRLVSHSTAANSFGRGADRVRWGLVCIDAGRQSTPLSLAFDRLTISSTEVGPLTGAGAPRPPAPAPHQRGHGAHAGARATVVHRAQGRHR